MIAMPRRSQLLVLMAAMLPLALSQHTRESNSSLVVPDSYLDRFPQCAIDCMPSACRASDLDCVCRNSTLQAQGAACLEASCSFPDVLFTQNLTQTICGAPVRDRSTNFKAMDIALGAVTLVFACMRLLSKWFFGTRHGFGPDDWVIVATGLIGIPSIVLNVVGLAAHGLGKDVWTLQPDIVPIFARYFYAMEILYIVLMTLVKLSLSLFYLDLFPGRTFRRLVWGTIFFLVAFGIAFVVKVFVQCSPVDHYWTQWSDKRSSYGHCININASAWANAGINVALDFWLIAIPLSQLHKLDLHWKKKVAAGIMFMTGMIVTIISILRLHSLIHFANSSNPTWDQYNVVWWSTVEVNVGIICTCLPSIRLILAHMFPRSFGVNLGLPAKPNIIERIRSNSNNIDIEQVELCGNELTREKTAKVSESSTRTDGGLEQVPHSAFSTD